jgi:phage tail sheath protein FI
VNLERKHTDQDLDDLNDANVNAIRNHPAGGIVVFGARTLKKTGSDRQISIRRNMIYLKKNSQLLTEFAIFEPNNSTTWGLIRDRLERFLTDHWSRGGLKGDVASEAFYVLCDETINTVQTIDAGELHVEVGVALVYAAEFIVFKIGQWEGGQTAFEV